MNHTLVLSNNQLKKCASNVRKSNRNKEKINISDLEIINKYRNQHKKIICSVFTDICDISKKVHNNSVIVFRLKRIDSIVRKLTRLETGLDRLQDIAGCRIIVDSIAQINSIVEKIDNHPSLKIKRTRNYIQNPRDSGYKSYHVIVEKIGFEHQVEIQIRTRNHHYWATFVEIIDHTFDIKIKEGDENKKIMRIHKLLSKSEENKLTEEEIIELVYLEKEKGILKKILNIFKSNYLIACQNWIEAGSSEDLEYILLKVIDNEPYFEFYKDFEAAESVYFQMVTKDIESNVVIININKPDITKLFLAYSNYVLVSHPFITRIIKYIFEVIILMKRNGDFNKLRDLKQYKTELMDLIEKGFMDEEIFIKGIHSTMENSEKSTNNIIDWYNNLRQRSSDITLKSIELENQLGSIRPKLKLKTIIPRFIYWLNN